MTMTTTLVVESSDDETARRTLIGFMMESGVHVRKIESLPIEVEE